MCPTEGSIAGRRSRAGPTAARGERTHRGDPHRHHQHRPRTQLRDERELRDRQVGRRIGLPLHGVSFPGHFLVKCALRSGAVVLDPFSRGASLGFDDLKKRLRNVDHVAEPSRSVVAAMLTAASNRDMLVRLLRNLKSIYTQQKAWLKALSISDLIIFATPDLAEEYRDRGMFYLNLECFRAALFDLQAYLKMLPSAKDADRVRSRMVELQSVAARLKIGRAHV